MTEPSTRTAQPPVLVTGASSGIGAAFARQLARQGHDPILVARRAARLQDLAAELAARHGARPTIVCADLARDGDVDRVISAIEAAAPLAYFVHAAGFGTRGTFADVAAEKARNQVQVHVMAGVRLCRAALPAMLAAGRGAIINVSSLGSFFTSKHYVTYSATKAFLNMFTEGLAAEVGHRGIHVQALCAGLTRTEFMDTSEYADFKYDDVPRWAWMTPEQVVAESLAALPRGPVLFVPGRQNRLFAGAMRTPLLGAALRQAIAWLSE